MLLVVLPGRRLPVVKHETKVDIFVCPRLKETAQGRESAIHTDDFQRWRAKGATTAKVRRNRDTPEAEGAGISRTARRCRHCRKAGGN